MCGIAGVVYREPREPGELAATGRKMARALAHRGPDGEGVWIDPGGRVVLAHRRLAIVDLSADGHQPMHDETGRRIIVYNGEIYNHPELRSELGNAGAHLRGHSDTEVLQAALREWGHERALGKCIGMFAFAEWDAGLQRLLLARDRAGKKPLYLYSEPGAVWFASEIKSLIAGMGRKPPLQPEAIHHYLTLGYIPAPMTAYQGITELSPGSWALLSNDLSWRSGTYWMLPEAASGARRPNEDDVVEEIDRLLSDAVRLRLRADVPVGIFLSGGIDSGLLTAMAARHASEPVRTFTVVFGEGEVDEREMAAEVSARYQTRHEAILLSPNVRDLLPRVARAFDEPFADPSALPTFAVAEAAAASVQVVLNGEGADELFGGYRRALAIRHLFGTLGAPLRVLPPFAVRAVNGALPTPRGHRGSYAFAHRLIRGAEASPASRYILWTSDGFDEEEKRILYGGATRYRPTTSVLEERIGVSGTSRGDIAFMSTDFVVGMGDCLLTKIDIATMAHGLEGRSPFLDHRVIELARSLDPRVLIPGLSTKYLLRRLAVRYLPQSVVRAPKRGFEIPLVRWMSHELRTFVHEVCLDPGGLLGELFDRRALERALLSPGTRIDPGGQAKRLWNLLMLALWDHEARSARTHAGAS